MSQALQDILGWVALTKAVNAVKDGVPDPLPPFLSKVRAEDKIIGDSVRFSRSVGTRKTARLMRYGAPPRHRELQQEAMVEAKFIQVGEQRTFQPNLLSMLRDYESYDNAQKAKQLVAHNVKTQGTMFANARIVAKTTSLVRGAIYFDSDGNMLPTSSGAAETYSQQIPSANIGTVVDGDGSNIFGATGLGSWATAATDIPLQLRKLQKTAAMQHGYTPKIAIYGEKVPGYLIGNNYVKDYLARHQPMRSQWLNDNTIPDGLFGFTWVPGWLASYEKDDGTKVSLWPESTITFIPGEEDTAAWWSMFEGSYEVPTSLNIQTDAASAMANLKTVYGAFGYGIVTPIPVSVAVVMGDTFFPAVKIPEVVYIADTVS